MTSIRKLLFVSSWDVGKDPTTGLPIANPWQLSRFTVRIPPLVPASTNSTRPTVIKVSVGQITIPFGTSIYQQTAVPFTPNNPALPVRSINMIRVKSSIASQNISSREQGFDSTLLQIPFTPNFFAVNSASNAGFSYVMYKANGEVHNQVTLVEPNIDTLTFWLTDEYDQPVYPAAHWFLTLVIDVIESFDPVDAINLLKQQTDTLKLLLLQGDHTIRKRLFEGNPEDAIGARQVHDLQRRRNERLPGDDRARG